MATTMRRNSTTTKTDVKTTVDNAVVEENVETKEVIKDTKVKETVEEVKAKIEPKKFEATDGIPCESITSGELGMIGIKSNINYRWADRNDTTEIEYQDLVAAVRSGISHITKPYFIIRDEDFISQFPQVAQIYESMYSISDLQDVLTMNIYDMESTINSLPDGAKQSIKNIAATMIQNGTLDSVNKIKKLDELFDTKLMLLTDLYND